METQYFYTQSPFDLKLLNQFFYLSDDEVQNKIENAWQDFLLWKKYSFKERSLVLLKIASSLSNQKNQMAELIHLEMGKNLSEAKLEVDKSIQALQYFAEQSESLLQNHSVNAHYKQTEIQFSPLGPILAIMPWNYPLWQLIRFAAPTWMLGNTVLLKPSEITAGVASMIEAIVRDQFPLLTNVLVEHSQIEPIIAHKNVRGVTLTGSTRAGKIIAEISGRHLKKTVLELGGNDPYIIFADADIDQSISICIQARLLNAGQSCISAKRFLIDEIIYEKWIQKFLLQLKQYPARYTLAHIRFQKQLTEQFDRLKNQSKLIYGGDFNNLRGAEFPVSVFKNVNFANFDDELFGPIFCFTSFRGDEEALKIANTTEFGLGASIMTQNSERIQFFQKNLEVGMFSVNSPIRSDVRVPFGGIKNSGYGREASLYGMLEFANIQMLGQA